MDGVLGMALSPYQRSHDRFLYFHSLASTTENVVNTKIIRNDSHTHDPNIDPDDVYVSQRQNRDNIQLIRYVKCKNVYKQPILFEGIPGRAHISVSS